MVSIPSSFLFFFLGILSIWFPVIHTGTVVEDLNNLSPPPEFNATLTANCHANPSLRYCNFTALDLPEIFRSTIVASHLCNISDNPNCVEAFPKINLHNQPQIAPLYLSFTFFWKFCPLTVISIDLANSSLEGKIPDEIFFCAQIQELDLSHNHLSGDLPVDKFSGLKNLIFLNLSYNGFSESRVSESHFFKRFNSSSFINSGLLPNRKQFAIKAVFLFTGFPVLVILTVVFCGWICFWRPDFLPRFLHRKHRFTPSILKAATDGFSERNLIGSGGGTGYTYRGVLRNGDEVKIKVYSDRVSTEQRRRFVETCKILRQLRHRNVLPVMGWCDHRKFRATVTEWKDEENVETWLSTAAPPWKQRMKVILGIAAGICYLHEECPEIVFDLKSRNVLLSEDGEPLITKFRFDDHHHGSAKKTYKFGMLALEMVTNRRPARDFESGESSFIEWVNLHSPDDLESVIDERMKRTGNVVDQATEVVRFGLVCTDLLRGRQPDWDEIRELVSNLRSMVKLASSNCKGQHRGQRHKHEHHRR